MALLGTSVFAPLNTNLVNTILYLSSILSWPNVGLRVRESKPEQPAATYWWRSGRGKFDDARAVVVGIDAATESQKGADPGKQPANAARAMHK